MASFAGVRRFVTRERAIDVGVVLVVLWFSLAQIGSDGFGEYEGSATEIDGGGFALALAGALPLLWRRRAPWPVFLITLGVGVATVSLGYAMHVHAGPPVGIYTIATRPERGPMWPLIAVALAGYAALVTIEAITLEISIEDYVFPAALWVGAWLVGDRRRTAGIRAAEARERAEREQELTIAEERTRIARELHDSAGHAINNILVQAGAARVLQESDPRRSREALTAVEEVARETLADIDRIVGALRDGEPAELAPLPGADAIADLVARHRAAGFEFALRVDGDRERAIPQPVDGAAYRIAQEALTNAARHGTGSAEIVVDRGADRLELTVTNPVSADGATARGAGGVEAGGGRGILGMRERAALLGGTLEAGRNGESFRVRAVLPYDRAVR
jgi:signal transduction histidine kinase